MSGFPNSFASQTQPLTADMFRGVYSEAAEELAQKGYEVCVGLTEEYADAIAEMSLQPSIKEYCPKDSSGRFASREATAEWIKKGRAVFLLVKSDDKSLAGYGWVGSGTSAHVPGGETTFALRVGEQSQGQGLATPFSRLILAGSDVLYGAKKLWLETWQSNAGAVHIYHKVGFEDVHQHAGERATQNGGILTDTRLYMSLNG